MSIEEHIEKGDSQKNNIVPADIVILSLISQLHSDMSDPVDGEETFTLSIDIQKVLYKFIFDYIYVKDLAETLYTMIASFLTQASNEWIGKDAVGRDHYHGASSQSAGWSRMYFDGRRRKYNDDSGYH